MFADAEQEKAYNAKKRNKKFAKRSKYDRGEEGSTRRVISKVIQPWEEVNELQLKKITKLRDIQEE